MIIYCVMNDCMVWSADGLEAVFSTEEKAQTYIDTKEYKQNLSIMKYALDGIV